MHEIKDYEQSCPEHFAIHHLLGWIENNDGSVIFSFSTPGPPPGGGCSRKLVVMELLSITNYSSWGSLRYVVKSSHNRYILLAKSQLSSIISISDTRIT